MNLNANRFGYAKGKTVIVERWHFGFFPHFGFLDSWYFEFIVKRWLTINVF